MLLEGDTAAPAFEKHILVYDSFSIRGGWRTCCREQPGDFKYCWKFLILPSFSFPPQTLCSLAKWFDRSDPNYKVSDSYLSIDLSCGELPIKLHPELKTRILHVAYVERLVYQGGE